MKSDNETDNEIEIDRVSVLVNETVENSWHFRNITFNSPSANYMVGKHLH